MNFFRLLKDILGACYPKHVFEFEDAYQDDFCCFYSKDLDLISVISDDDFLL